MQGALSGNPLSPFKSSAFVTLWLPGVWRWTVMICSYFMTICWVHSSGCLKYLEMTLRERWLAWDSLPRETQREEKSLNFNLFYSILLDAVRMQERTLELEPKLEITRKLYQQSWDTLVQHRSSWSLSLSLPSGINVVTQSLKEAGETGSVNT